MSIISPIKALLCKRHSSAFVKYLRNKGMVIGTDTTFLSPRKTYIDENRAEWIKIGSQCVICRNVSMIAHDYSWITLLKYNGSFLPSGGGRINIGDNVFVGEGSTILRDVNIGDNCIIGANSVVTRDIPANSVAVGCPAKVIMNLDEYIEFKKIGQTKEIYKNITYLKQIYGDSIPEVKLKNFRVYYMARNEINIHKYIEENGFVGINKEYLIRCLRDTYPLYESVDDMIFKNSNMNE